MAVNTRVLAGSLAAAVLISVGGGYVLSRSDGTDDEIARIPSNPTFTEPGIETNKPVQGEPLPIVDLLTTDDATISTAELLGQPLVINVWATTCEACKTEMPALARVQEEYGDSVRFVGVNTLVNTPSALAFAEDKGVHYELLSDHNGELQGALGIIGLPYTLFVAADGTIVAQKGIALSEQTIRENVAALTS